MIATEETQVNNTELLSYNWPESNMSCIEAKTIDDMNAVFKKLSDGHEKSTVKAMEPEDDRDGRDASEQH